MGPKYALQGPAQRDVSTVIECFEVSDAPLNRSLSFRVNKVAAPAPKLCPVMTNRQPCKPPPMHEERRNVNTELCVNLRSYHHENERVNAASCEKSLAGTYLHDQVALWSLCKD